MNSPIIEINDLQARILAGEEPTEEELRAAIQQLRSQRKFVSETPTGKKTVTKAQKGEDLLNDL